MTVEIDRNLLLPERYPQDDLFVCDIADATLKDIMQDMEYPFYTLSKKPDTSVRRFTHGENWLEITPSVKGIATIYDKDILIYAISQLIAKLNKGEKVSNRVRINCHELLMFANRGTSGKDYNAVCEAIDRLAGTRITTNIKSGGEEQYSNFGLIEAGSVRRKDGLDGRIQWVELKLSDWVFNAIRANEVLTLHRDYFRLRKPIERRVYEVARKFCGRQSKWTISIANLHKRSGSRGSIKEFRRALRALAETNHLPDYTVKLNAAAGDITFYNRKSWWDEKEQPSELPVISNEAKLNAEKYTRDDSVDDLVKAWYDYWIDTGCPRILNPDAAFIGFCKSKYTRTAQGSLFGD